MANYKSAYLTKQPNPIDPSDWINKQQEISQYYDGLKRQKEAEEQAKKDKLLKQFDTDFSGEFDLSSMGNQNVNEVFSPLAHQSLPELKQAHDQGRKALEMNGINSKEYLNAVDRYNNILKRPALFRLTYSEIAKKLNSQAETLATGDYVQDPDSIKALNDFTSQPLKYWSDPSGNIIVQQGDKVSEMGEFAKNMKLPEPIKKFNTDTYMTGIVKGIGEHKIAEKNGYTTTTTTNSWDDFKEGGQKRDGIRTMLERHFEKELDDDTMNRILATNGEFGYNEMTIETKDKLKAKKVNEFLEEAKLRLKQEKDIDFKFAPASVSNPKVVVKPGVSGVADPTPETFPTNYKNIDASKVNSVAVTNATPIAFIKSKGGEELSNLVPHNFTRNKNGNLVVAATFQESKSTKLQVDKVEQGMKSWDAFEEYDKKVKEFEKNGETAALEDLKEKRRNKKLELQESSKTLGAQNTSKDVIIPKDQESIFADAMGMSVEEMNSRIYKPKTNEKVDEFGVPIKE